jgi:membrane protein DedA with SNARE-associated domain
VLLGYVTGNSYKAVEKTVGRGAALAVLGLVLVAFVIWRIRAHRAEAAREHDPADHPDPSPEHER